MQKIKQTILKHPEIFTFLGLFLIFYIIFFHNNWAYPLMDVDETRYVSMSKDMFSSKDFMTLYLNGDYFFEKPPLYFWGECLSFFIFGKITEWTARFPVALYGTLTCFMTYFLGRKIISRGYGVVSSLILATSFEFVILSKYAILDILLACCTWLSISFGILTFYCKDKNKKYFWWLFYIFSGLAVMAKGVPGFIIPFGSMFFVSLYAKKFKEIFRPQYFIVGVILFLLVVLPWHIIMLKTYDPLFFNEYIMKHHVSRFFGSEIINRNRPFYFYILTILWGFLPWIVSSLAVLIRKIYKWDFRFREVGDAQNFIAYNSIIAGFIFLFFSSSETKLITYILPIYPALSCIAGYAWFNYIERGEYKLIINKTVYFVGILFILGSIGAILVHLIVPSQLYLDIFSVKHEIAVLFCIFGILPIIFALKGKYIGVFLTYVLFMSFLSAFFTEKFFEIDYKFGQDDLMKFAQYSKEKGKSLSTYNVNQKYSLLYYGNGDVDYNDDSEVKDIQKLIDKPNDYIVVKNDDMKTDMKKFRFRLLMNGRKYSLIDR